MRQKYGPWKYDDSNTFFYNSLWSFCCSANLNYCICCCCCGAYLSSCHRTASDANLLDDPHTFHYQDYFVIGGIRTCSGVSDDPMFVWISSNSCPLNLLLVRSHQAEIIIVKRLIQGRNNVTRVRVEPRSFDQGRRKNDAVTHSATLPTMTVITSTSGPPTLPLLHLLSRGW